MDNIFTVEQIKNSVEYKWRMFTVKGSLICWLFMSVVSFFLCLVNFKFEDLLWVWLIFVGVFGLILVPIGLYYYFKARYIVKNYKKFDVYEVKLDRVNNSFMYRGASYYTVEIVHNNLRKCVDTNPYFQTHFGIFHLDDYNNQKVVGLYDPDNEEFYIVNKV